MPHSRVLRYYEDLEPPNFVLSLSANFSKLNNFHVTSISVVFIVFKKTILYVALVTRDKNWFGLWHTKKVTIRLSTTYLNKCRFVQLNLQIGKPNAVSADRLFHRKSNDFLIVRLNGCGDLHRMNNIFLV